MKMEDMLDREKAVLKELDKKTLAKAIDDVFLHFASALRTAQIFEPNNISFVQQVQPLYAAIQNLIQNLGKAVLLFRANALFFNTIRIKIDFHSYQRFKFLVNEFKQREIEAIGFQDGLDEEEFKRFIVIFAKAREKKLDSYDAFVEELARNGITHIFLERLHPYEMTTRMTPDEIRRSAKKVFFKSIAHLQEVLEKGKKQEKLYFKTSRRLIQTILNLIGHDESFMLGLANIKNYQEYTLNHSINVAILCLCLGRRLGLEKNELLDLGLAAFFHDIGKLDIPLEILDKNGKLDDEERKIIETHPRHGLVKLVCMQDLTYFPIRALSVALEHHIWADLSSGYPKSWKKKDLNLFSMIAKICDFFDAVTTKRIYRKFSFTREQALGMMCEHAGSEFDPVLLKVFANMIGVFPVGTLVALDSEELAIVVETNPEEEFMLRPKVKLITDKDKNKIDGEIVDLSEKDPETGKFSRSIVKTLNPEDYGVNVAHYFLAQAI